MAHDIWFISDTHFFHENVLRFKDKEGDTIRPFPNVWDMNEHIVDRWNGTIKPQDKVYHLGDVALSVTANDGGPLDVLLGRLNGHKRLILGNHDRVSPLLLKHFERIELWTGGKFKEHGFVASHIPLRDDQMRGVEFNVHGHIHQNPSPSERHYCVCVEQTEYFPVHIDHIKRYIADVKMLAMGAFEHHS